MIQFHSFGLWQQQRYSCRDEIDHGEGGADDEQAGVADNEVRRYKGAESRQTAAHAVARGTHLCGVGGGGGERGAGCL